MKCLHLVEEFAVVLNCVVCLRNNAVCIFTPKTLAIYIILYLELPYRDSSSPCLVHCRQSLRADTDAEAKGMI